METPYKHYNRRSAVLRLCLVRQNGKSTATDKAFFECTTIGKPELFFDSYYIMTFSISVFTSYGVMSSCGCYG